MHKWILGLVCCGLLVCVLAPLAAAQEAAADPAVEAAKAKYGELQKQADELRRQMGKFRGKYEKDDDVAAARKASDAARKGYDQKVKASAVIAEARKAVEAARKQLDDQLNAAMLADPQAGPVVKKYQDATKRLQELREEIKTLTADQRKLQREVSAHRSKFSRNRELAKDARAAITAADKAYREAVKGDATVQAASKAADEARANYEKVRKLKLAADPEYAQLVEKQKALDKEMRALRDQMRKRPGRRARPKPKRATKAGAVE